MAKILIIDDDESMCSALSAMISKFGYHPVCATRLAQGLSRLLLEPFDLVFLDVNLPDGNGLDSLPHILNTSGSPMVIILTGEGDPDGAELAIQSGAWDYIEKQSFPQYLQLTIKQALEYRRLRINPQHAVSLDREGIVGSSAAMKSALDELARAAGTDANVLLTGETGTGKDCFALAIHTNSLRAGKNFVVVDCTALPEPLVESILFGHERGAFTGAMERKEGLIRQAHGGTLFLDEVGELPLVIQKNFLRVLEEKRFRPVGGREEVESDFRLVAATNRDLDLMVRNGTFREDLLFRLRSFYLHLPPLRERKGDVIDLALHYISRQCEKRKINTKGFSPEFVEALNEYSWPGNVRELFNTLDYTLSAAKDEPILFPVHLPKSIRVQLVRGQIRGKQFYQGLEEIESVHVDVIPPVLSPSSLSRFREENERKYLLELLDYTHWNISQACRVAQISRPHLHKLINRHGITRQTKQEFPPSAVS